MKEKTRILSIVPVRNRRETTLRFLNSLKRLRKPERVMLDVMIIDDGSTDGTSDAVRSFFPEVKIVSADGSLFWSGAIQEGLSLFRKQDYNYAWLLNDDMEVNENCLVRLLEATDYFPGRIYSGTVESPSGSIIYGGIARQKWFRFTKIGAVDYKDGYAFPDTINGNCVLISSILMDNFDWPPNGVYVHEGFDLFLGLEAKRLGSGPVVVRDAICVGEDNSSKFWFYSREFPIADRLRGILDRKGVPPRMYWNLCSRFAGPLAPFYFVRPYLISLIGRK